MKNDLSQEMYESLQSIAFQKSKPFCYSCYQEAPNGHCGLCRSDDLMRLLPGVGCEWGVDWVIRHLIEESLHSAEVDSSFEDSVSQCYPEQVQIGWITYDTVSAIKELDPVSWDLAKSEWLDNEVSDGNLVTFDHGSTYYWTTDVESFIESEINKTMAS